MVKWTPQATAPDSHIDVDAHDRLLFIYGLLADAQSDANRGKLADCASAQGQALYELITLLVDLKVLPIT